MQMAEMSSRKVYRESLARLLPDIGSLEIALNQILATNSMAGSVTILKREAFKYASTFPSELITCESRGGKKHCMLGKYGVAPEVGSNGHGGGPSYEAYVYREVVGPSGITGPIFYGDYRHPDTHDTWLFIEYLTNGVRLDETPSPEQSLIEAAVWSGHFHSGQQQRLESGAFQGLKVYTQEFYQRWISRVKENARDSSNGWLRQICDCFSKNLEGLTAPPQTVIHGEFTVHNVLKTDHRICPVDWESAAVAPGEIDLASLTEGWPGPVVEACERAYENARWPNAAPPDFAHRLTLARVYWSLRWLGHARGSLDTEKAQKRLQRIRGIAEGLGWI